MLKANITKRIGITLLNSSLRCFNIFIQDIGIVSGQNIIVIKNITKDKNLSSGEEVG
jgi:hypothetical protein